MFPSFFDNIESELSQQTQSTKPPNHSVHLATKTPTTQPTKNPTNPTNFSKKEEEETKPQIMKQNIKQPHPLRHTHTHTHSSLIIGGLFIVKITHLLLLLVGGRSGKLVTMVVNERPMKRRIFADLYDFHTFPTTTTTNT
ncbi:hypothetical protein ACJW30_05G219200 [Castanea mollissima]